MSNDFVFWLIVLIFITCTFLFFQVLRITMRGIDIKLLTDDLLPSSSSPLLTFTKLFIFVGIAAYWLYAFIDTSLIYNDSLGHSLLFLICSVGATVCSEQSARYLGLRIRKNN